MHEVLLATSRTVFMDICTLYSSDNEQRDQ